MPARCATLRHVVPSEPARPARRGAFDRWLDHVELETVRELVAPGMTVALIASTGAVLAVLALTHAGRRYADLRPSFPTITFVLSSVALVVAAPWLRARRTFGRREGIVTLLTFAPLFLHCGVLLGSAGAIGSPILALPLALIMGTQGYLFRARPREPFALLASIPALALAAALRPDFEHFLAAAIAGSCGALIGFVLGSVATRIDEAHREREDMRAAIAAQMLDEEHRNVVQLTRRLERILGSYHDVGNTLMSAMMSCEACLVELERDTPNRAVAVESIRGVSEALEDVRTLLADVRTSRRSDGAAPVKRVDVMHVARAARDHLAPRWPSTSIECALVGGDPPLAAVRGGESSLRRVLENLVLNACQGNGRDAARTVRIEVGVDPSTARVKVTVRDDGPGFPTEQLAHPIEGFRTTKRAGSGLGLYTSERLVLASSGSLRRANAAGGGAVVEIELPAADG